MLQERPAFDLVAKLIPQPDFKKKKEAIKAASKAFNAVGMTSINDGGSYVDEYQAYQEVMNEGDLTVRVYAMAWITPNEMSDEGIVSYINHIGPRQGFGNDYLKFGALKIVIDGGVGGRTALMRTPYISGKPNNYGIQVVPQDRLRKIIKYANQKGWQMAIHTCGGKAMDNALEIFREADQEKSIKGRRWYFVHGYDPSPQNLEDMRRMEVGVAPPTRPFSASSAIVSCRAWGRSGPPMHRLTRINSLKQGVHISGGADAPVTPFPPLWGIYGAVTRRAQLSKEDPRPGPTSGDPGSAANIYDGRSLDVTFEEKTKGSIEPGKLADMVVLGEDIP